MSSIREQISHPMPNPPQTLLSTVVEIHGWSNLALDTPWSISVLTVALLNEALKVSSRLQLCFFCSQTVLRCTAMAMDALFCLRP